MDFYKNFEKERNELTNLNKAKLQQYINNYYNDNNISVYMGNDNELDLKKSYILLTEFDKYNDFYSKNGIDPTVEYNRLQRYSDYAQMEKEGYLNRGLKIYANSMIQKDLEGKILHLYSANSKILNILENLFFNVLNIEKLLWRFAYRLLKFGDLFIRVVPDSYINPNGIDKIEIIENPADIDIIMKNNQILGYIYKKEKIFYSFEIIHFKIDTGLFYPFGESILEAARVSWKYYKMLKNLLIIQRVENADKTAILVPIGNKSPEEIRQYLNLVRDSFKKRDYIDSEGYFNTSLNPSSFFEKYYIPIKGDGQQTIQIQPIAQAKPINNQEDVELIRDEMIKSLNIPNAYMGIEAGGELANATLSQLDINFARTIENRIEDLLKGLYKIAYIELILKKVINSNNFKNFIIELTPPSDLAEQRAIQVISDRFNAISNILNTNLLPKKYILKKYLGFSDKELITIEAMMKEETGETSSGGGGGGGGFEAGVTPMGSGEKIGGGEEEGSGEIPGEAGNPAVGGQPPVENLPAEGGEAPKTAPTETAPTPQEAIIKKIINKVLLEKKEKPDNFYLKEFYDNGEINGVFDLLENKYEEKIIKTK